MTVKELIGKLLEANMDSQVYLQGYNYGSLVYRELQEANEFNMATVNGEPVGLFEEYEEELVGSCWAVIIE